MASCLLDMAGDEINEKQKKIKEKKMERKPWRSKWTLYFFYLYSTLELLDQPYNVRWNPGEDNRGREQKREWKEDLLYIAHHAFI